MVNWLYVAVSSSDAVAVFDLRESRGTHSQATQDRPYYFIPTEWYPTALAISGNDLFVVTGKGVGTGPNSAAVGTSTPDNKPVHPYIASMIRRLAGASESHEAERDREALTAEVLQSNRMEGRTDEIAFQRGANPIRHVIYIIKENRTYDQIFGDIKEANGDPSLVMYGEDITPNQHKLARQFGVLDNFYDSGEVSGDGHPWSMAAITTDYNEKAWPIAYRGGEREYDSEGSVGDVLPLNEGIPDVNEPATGYLFDNLARHSMTYRHYGEYIETRWCEELEQKYAPAATGAPTGKAAKCERGDIKPGEDLPTQMGGGKSPYQYVIPLMAYNSAAKAELRNHFDPKYPDFKVEYPDQFRVDEFLREFAGFVAARKSGKGEQLPNFSLVRLPNDHTAGTKPGSPTPNAAVADNDLAVGRVVEAVSNSPYWDDTAIFVIEDDAQNGADHVDAHRSIGAGDQQVLAARAAALRRSQLLHHGEHDPHHGDAARPAADEQQRRLRRRDGAAVHRPGRPASVQGRLSQSRQRHDLPGQREERSRREGICGAELLGRRCRRHRDAQRDLVARRQGRRRHARTAAYGDSGFTQGKTSGDFAAVAGSDSSPKPAESIRPPMSLIRHGSTRRHRTGVLILVTLLGDGKNRFCIRI